LHAANIHAVGDAPTASGEQTTSEQDSHSDPVAKGHVDSPVIEE
jgi:hypothetical protein